MDHFLNGRVGADPGRLRGLLESLAKERDLVEQQLRGEVAVSEGDNEWQTVVAEVRTALTQLEDLKTACNQLYRDGEGVTLGTGEEGRCADELRERARQLLQAQHLQAYLSLLQNLMQLCSKIEDELLPGGDIVEAVRCHGDLGSVASRLESSRCRHLVEYSISSHLWWGERLRERVVSDFSDVLSDMKWPFSSSTLSFSLHDFEKHNVPFTDLFGLLLKLDPVTPAMANRGDSGASDMADPLLYPIEQLVQPLRKRFRYHFTGERSTNRLDKPEWCFTHVSSWIRGHTPFLEKVVQPLLDGAGFGHFDAVTEFVRGLLQEVELKLRHNIQDMVQDDLLMAHLVDELILFTRELTLIGYPPSCPSPLSVLLDHTPFSKWLALERQFAEERLVELSASPTAWSPVYDSAVDTDDTRVPEAAEALLTLIAGITDRYRNLPSVGHQLDFVELQRCLLQSFLHSLSSSPSSGGGGGWRSEGSLSQLTCAHLNACHYVAEVLKAWGEMEFFVSLHYSEQEHAQNHTHSSPFTPAERPDIETIVSLRRQDSTFAELEGNIFSFVCTEFRSHCDVLQDRLMQHVVASFRTACRPYQREHWQLQESESADTLLLQEPSPSLSAILPQLQGQLTFLTSHLSFHLFASIFNRLSNHIDQVLFTDVIFPTHFGVGGAKQLNFDLTMCFLPMLSQFCEELLARQLLERSREACRLLQLLPGSAKLLQELLVGVVRGGTTTPIDTYTAAVTTLNEFGVHTLEPVQAYQILTHMIAPS